MTEPFEIQLANGRGVALVSSHRADLVSRRRWQLHGGKRYAHATTEVKGKRYCFLLHRVIAEAMGLDMSHHIDHINGNGLDCRDENLRSATNAQNQANRHVPSRRKSGFRGVRWHSRPGRIKRFQAVAALNGANISLGYYLTAEEAARAWDADALTRYGDFARLNFPVKPFGERG